jgi:hypothetical protein
MGSSATGRARRAAAGVLAAWVAIGQLASVAHHAVVVHVTCSEHGEALHLQEASDGASHRHVDPCVRPTAETTPQHDHCLIAAFRKERCSREAGVVARAFAPAPERSLVAPATTRPSTIPLVRLAPKNSPPV